MPSHKTMPSGRVVINLFDEGTQKQVGTASASDFNEGGGLATASTLSNMTPEQCPKCGTRMGTALIATGDTVYHCIPCRVTNPIPQA